MGNIYKYNSHAEYLADTTRPANESSVSYDGGNVHYEAKNSLIPIESADASMMGYIVVKNTIDSKLYLIAPADYDASSLNGVMKVMDCVFMGDFMDKYLFLYKNQRGTLWNATNAWAIPNYYKIECDTTANGGFQFSVIVDSATKTGTISWSAGATIASIVADINTAAGSSIAVDKTTFVGISVNQYSTTAMSISNATGATLTDLSIYCKVNGTLQSEVHRAWRYASPSTMFPALGLLAPNNKLFSNGGWNNSYRCIGNLARCKAVGATGKSATFAAEDTVAIMTQEAFTACGQSVVAAEKAVYDKYNGNYDAYLTNHMCKIDSTRSDGSEYQSAEAGLNQTVGMSSVTTLDLDGNYVCAYPAAYLCSTVAVSGDDRFGAGKWHLPTVRDLATFIEDGNMAKLNAGIAKIGGNAVSNASYYWSCVECSVYGAWCYHYANGCVGNDAKYIGFGVRPVLALSK